LLLLNNWAHVKADEFIVGRVSSETKARLRALAEKEMLSESALLRRLVELVLLKAGLSPILTESPTGARPRRGARLMIRLRPDDQILLRERAAARGMPAATYVSVLTRSHLRSLAPLPAEELLALKRTIGELGSIGRNLNQIARAANQGQLVTSPGRDDLTAMLRVCGTLRDSLKRVLLANLKSWEQGSPWPRLGGSNRPQPAVRTAELVARKLPLESIPDEFRVPPHAACRIQLRHSS
jgi:Bacterial mobilisation protein (MobC)